MSSFQDENKDRDDLTSNNVRAPEDADSVGRAFHQKRNLRLIADSSADWSPEVARQLGVELLYFTYVTPEGERVDDLYQSRPAREFYDTLREHPELHYTTSAITPGRYHEVFERAAKEGTPTIYIGLTAGLSSSILNAYQAQQMIAEEYPDFELYVLDNEAPSACGELLVIEMAHQADKGLSAREVYEWACEARSFLHGYFMLENFQALAAGGRIPPAAATVGSKLDIKPVLSYDDNGALTIYSMCRGRRKALRAIVGAFQECHGHDPSLPLVLVSSDAEKDADWVEAEVRKLDGCEGLLIIRSQISPILGSHVGPGMVGLGFWGVDRRERLSFADKLARKVKRSEG